MSSVLPLDLIAPFDSLLRDDPSAENLLIWADALEDAGDEACRGVREFLVGMNRSPGLTIPGYSLAEWWIFDGTKHHFWVPGEIGKRRRSYSDELRRSRLYEQRHLGPHYYTIALYDAAQAWCELNPPRKE